MFSDALIELPVDSIRVRYPDGSFRKRSLPNPLGTSVPKLTHTYRVPERGEVNDLWNTTTGQSLLNFPYQDPAFGFAVYFVNRDGGDKVGDAYQRPNGV